MPARPSSSRAKDGRSIRQESNFQEETQIVSRAEVRPRGSASREENGRRGGACTDETGTRRNGGREWWRIYVMKRSPGWSRA